MNRGQAGSAMLAIRIQVNPRRNRLLAIRPAETAGRD
jgi:hypothetical protein